MPPRPLYRWKSFWLGVFMLGFLAWAWCDSFRFESQFWVAVVGKCVWLTRSGGQTFYVLEWNLPVAFDFGAMREPAALALGETSITGPRIADAPFVGLSAFAWIAFLAWRWRRMRRAHIVASG